MPITWDADMDRKLFLAVLETSDVKVDSAAVAEKFTADGHECSAIAIQRRLQKIRSTINKAGGEGEATPKKKATPAKRGKDKDDDEATPSKKGKTTKGTKKQGSKEEGEEDEGGDDAVKQENGDDA